MLPIADSTRKGLDQITTGLSTAATALTMIPGPAGVAAAGLVAVGSVLGSVTNMLAIVGEHIGENKERLKESPCIID